MSPSSIGSRSSPTSSRGWKRPKNFCKSSPSPAKPRLGVDLDGSRATPAPGPWGVIDDSSSDVRASNCNGFSASSKLNWSSSILGCTTGSSREHVCEGEVPIEVEVCCGETDDWSWSIPLCVDMRRGRPFSPFKSSLLLSSRNRNSEACSAVWTWSIEVAWDLLKACSI